MEGSTLKITNIIAKKCQEHRKLRGYTDPYAIAHLLVGGDHSPYYKKIVKTILNLPTQNFLYPHVYSVLENLYQLGDYITIWSQGSRNMQIWRFARSGLANIRKSKDPEAKKRFSILATRNKTLLIEGFLETFAATGIKKIFFVDNKLTHLLTASEKIQQLKEQGKIPFEAEAFFINIQHDTSPRLKKTLQKSIPNLSVISNITELLFLRKKFSDDKVYWFIDLGNTLLDSNKLYQATYQKLANIIESMPFTISPLIDCELGLHGKITDYQALETGDTMREAFAITLLDNQKKVIKHNSKERVLRESQGYDLLSPTPLGPHMPYPEFIDIQEGIIILPFVDGIPLRLGAKKASIPLNTGLKAFNELLTLKKAWWSTQIKRHHEFEAISVQRLDWPNTLEKIPEALTCLSKEYGLTPAELMAYPIVTPESKMRSSLNEMIKTVNTLLTTRPDYTILTHGDIIGANFLINPTSGTWSVIDPEFAGYGDPAESLVKIIKYETTTTVQSVLKNSLQVVNQCLEIQVEVQFSELARCLHATGLAIAKEFSLSLKDATFLERFRVYLAGSYLREIALTLRRNRPDLVLFAISKAAQAYHLIF
ncbi:MAG: hypothetical protein K0S08_60 [Gammaproteobacteria bacterium]|jgi:hypothetical protein|nr:hypothetical protein [Gammaproteobacteria bacterium]